MYKMKPLWKDEYLLPCLVVVLATVGHASGNAQSLAKGASGYVNVVLTLEQEKHNTSNNTFSDKLNPKTTIACTSYKLKDKDGLQEWGVLPRWSQPS